MRKLIAIMTFPVLILIQSCGIQESGIFTPLSTVEAGLGANLSLNEDATMNFSYEIPINEDSINPLPIISAQPQHGALSNCAVAANMISCLYTPSPNFFGVDKILIKGQDGELISPDTAVITIDVLPVNDAPSISNHIVNGNILQEKITFSIPMIGLEGTDLETSANNLKYYVDSSALTVGSVTCMNEGTSQLACEYTTQAVGSFDAKIRVEDEGSLSAEANIKFVISNVALPSGNDLAVNVIEDTPKIFNYSISNLPSDVSNPMIIIDPNFLPTHGSVVKNNCTNQNNTIDCSFTYTPDANYYGVDEFQVYLKDDLLQAATNAKITLNISPVNDAPTTQDYTINIARNSTAAQAITVVDIDTSLANITYSITENPDSNKANISCAKDAQQIYQCTINSLNVAGSTTAKIRVFDGDNAVFSNISIIVDNTPIAKTDTFNYNPNPADGVDIMWVIDNSGSMDGEQTDLANNFSSFIDNFVQAFGGTLSQNGTVLTGPLDTSFRMAITTTDAYKDLSPTTVFVLKNGNIVPLQDSDALYDYATFKQDFQTAIKVGTSGSQFELALRSLRKAYDSIDTYYSDWNEPTSNRMLVSIILTDEKEQSPNSINGYWVPYLKGLKVDSKLVTCYNIIDPNNAGNGYNSRYPDLSAAFNTPLYNIADPFDDILDSLASQILANFNIYKLDYAGVLVTTIPIVVKLNGVVLPEFNGANPNWTLEADNKTLKILIELVAGDVITVDYTYLPQ